LSVLDIPTAKVFTPLLEPARYKGAYGGRGSGKSHFFAEDGIDHAIRWKSISGEGLRMLCFREIQKSLKESAKFLIESKLRKFGIGERDGFKVYTDRIQTPGDGVIAFTGMQDHTADTIKSYEGFHIAWGEESQSISSHSLSLLRPTIRWESEERSLSSELWFSWNPRFKSDAVDRLLRGEATPTNTTVVKANWSDNRWFPKVLEEERLDCLRIDPDGYDHIWEGGYATVTSGAYYARHIVEARQQNRITSVTVDPLMTIRLFVDIGGTGAKSDAFTIWAAQFIGTSIRWINYYEAVGQPLATHLVWLREQGYTPNKAQIWLPHDGKTNDKVYDVSYESALRQAGYQVTVVPNQGKGAAKARIEAGRRLFPSMMFDAKKCEAGLGALGWYHEKKDEQRNIGLGPEHDWASHGADAFGLGCIVFEPAKPKKPKNKPKLGIA
jgi:phage terminase large subunit